MAVARSSLVVVAGGSGAIGREIAARLSGDYQVIATWRRQKPQASPGIDWVRFDTGDRSTIETLAGTINASKLPLAAILFCIGMPSTKRVVTETPDEEFAELFAGNVTSLVITWRCLASKARVGSASLVVIGSNAAHTQRSGNGPYTAAKLAMEGLVRTLAREEQSAGVRVNAVSPSLVASPLAEHVLKAKGVGDVPAYYGSLPWGRALSVGEVAQVAIDIALAPQWRYVTGQVFRLGAADDD
jgi:3-oxoacyl-[acyl-carrier protein] reductase